MIHDEVFALEERLLLPEVRTSAAALDRLIADEFMEFGSSGQTYTKQDVIAQLQAAPNFVVKMEGFRVMALAPDVALATYRTGRSLRSSIWRQENGAWRIVFHQGTVIAPENARNNA
jgi:hypothetical protein